ncbi:MAG: hypothetical protein JWQ43_436 [Glaciihabitans sp.]|nr:hypothetical protein [Glaciihabitans sp.]
MTSGVLTRPPHLGGGGNNGGHPPLPARASRRRGLRSARLIALASVLLTATLAFHTILPGGLGSTVGTVLPWLGVVIPVLLVVAIMRRARRSWMLVGAPLLAWLVIFVPQLVPLSAAPAAAAGEITIASQNVEADSGTAGSSGLSLADSGADVIALEELTASARREASAALEATHPYSYTVGTVGVWSIYPLANVRALSLGLGWNRALAAEVETPAGPVSLYVVHAASIRPGKQDDRDTMIDRLAQIVADDTADRVVAVGDFNAATSDPALRPLTSVLDESRQTGGGLGFTWPTAVPLTRIDHIFQRGLPTVEQTVLQAGDSDHLAVVARFTL